MTFLQALDRIDAELMTINLRDQFGPMEFPIEIVGVVSKWSDGRWDAVIDRYLAGELSNTQFYLERSKLIDEFKEHLYCLSLEKRLVDVFRHQTTKEVI